MANDDYLNPIRRMIAKRREFRVRHTIAAWTSGPLYVVMSPYDVHPWLIYDGGVQQWFRLIAPTNVYAVALSPDGATPLEAVDMYTLHRAGGYKNWVCWQLTGQAKPIFPPQVGDVRWDGAVWTGNAWRSK